MSITIPKELKADVPQTTWGKILTSTPIVMTVLATMLAGLASSEMTRAQYDRALAAQLQSKAGDQWSFFQAKRLRGALQRNAVDLLQGTVEVHQLDATTFSRKLVEQIEIAPANAPEAAQLKSEVQSLVNSPQTAQTLDFLAKGRLPSVPAPQELDPKVKIAMQAVENSVPDTEVLALLNEIPDKSLEQSLKLSRDAATALDSVTKPINQSIDQLETVVGRISGLGTGTGPSLSRDFTAARLRYAAVRYEAEARVNQSIANLYELQVRKSNTSAARHHARSQRFFFGMLAAQAAVIIATFAIAARNRNLLWSLAATAGLLAVALSIYVYLFV
jgi:hypothetical protein